ncbi:MAG: peptidoglycan editing factor PgeF [Fusobacteria bacterium]|nr:peptidoglycan editing factor PgeF [Fusobacteriota bacterium]
MFKKEGYFYQLSAGDIEMRFTTSETPYIFTVDKDIKLFELLQIVERPILTVHQVHSDRVVAVTKAHKTEMLGQADGIITNDPNVLILIKNADCLPIYMYSRDGSVFGAIHSGWKGSFAGIGKKALACFKSEFNVTMEEVCIVLGIAAQKCCYEVTREFFEEYSDAYPFMLEGVFYFREGKVFYDNAQFLMNHFLAHGVKEENIVVDRHCTICSGEFHSFRKDATKRRNYALIYRR